MKSGPVVSPPRVVLLLVAAFLASMLVRGMGDTTAAMIVSSVVIFGACLGSAVHLLGARAAAWFVAIAVVFGWSAEQMGSSHGWFFGSYHYTAVLGPRLGDVPLVIALMWIALAYIGYVISNLIVVRAPVDAGAHAGEALWMSLLAAMIVTACDLGADPYMVHVLQAWVMTRTDGDRFGETVQGFVGWTVVGLAIIVAFRLVQRRLPAAPAGAPRRCDALLPVAIYAGLMVFQVVAGEPVETRSIAAFAMGIAVVCALAGWRHWGSSRPTKELA